MEDKVINNKDLDKQFKTNKKIALEFLESVDGKSHTEINSILVLIERMLNETIIFKYADLPKSQATFGNVLFSKDESNSQSTN